MSHFKQAMPKPFEGIIILTGVAGVGKTTIGTALAKQLGWHYLEGDDFHPPANIQKMSQGQALTDTDRLPWLQAIQAQLQQALASQQSIVLSCSALKQSYRQMLRIDRNRIKIIQLVASKSVLQQRLAHRSSHFFGPQLLDSQLATLETASEVDLVVQTDQPVEDIVKVIIQRLTALPRKYELP